MTILLRDDFTGSGNVAGRTPDGVHTGAWADDSYFGGAASNTNITGGALVPLTPYRFGASIALAGPPTNAYIEVALLSADVTYPAGAKTMIGLGTTIGSNATGVFCTFRRVDAYNIDVDLTVRHSDFSSGTTTATLYIGDASNFRVRLEVQGVNVAVLGAGVYGMRAVLNAPMAAGRAFIGAEFADTKFDWVQAGFLPAYIKPPLLNLSGTVLLETFSGDGLVLQYNPPEITGGSFAGLNYYNSSAGDIRNGGWLAEVASSGNYTELQPGFSFGVWPTEVSADMIFRTAESLPTSYAASGDLLRLTWKYGEPASGVFNEIYDVFVTYLTGTDATTLVGGGATAGYYLKVTHDATTLEHPAVTQYTALPTIGPEEVHHLRVDQFRSASQLYFFDDVLIATTAKATTGATHKMTYIRFDSGLDPGSGISDPPLQIGGIRFMPAASFLGPPYFWRDLISTVETR